MAALFVTIALSLQAVPAFAGENIARRWDTPAYCSGQSSALSSILHPTQSFDASAFCSQYLGPTSWVNTLAATVTGPTIRQTYYTTTKTTTTRVDARPSTVTALCPTPSPSAKLSCNVPGSGNSNNFISFKEPFDPVLCHQECLKMPSCKSFQIVNDNGDMRCNFWNAETSAVIFPDKSGLMFFYDRDCPDLLPAGCAASAPAAITPKPAVAPALAGRDVIPYPDFLGIGRERMWILCSCVIQSPLPTTTTTNSITLSLNSYVSTTKVVTRVYTVSQNPNWSTVYTTAS